MEQVYTPNVLVAAVRAFCLKYIDDAGNAPSRTATARYSWEVERNAGRIKTTTIPENVWLVGWLDFTAGMYTSYGHVFFIKRNGNNYQIYDSEVQSRSRVIMQNGKLVNLGYYKSIEELLSWFGAYKPKYIGWSTHCDGREYAKLKENNMGLIQDTQEWFRRCNDTQLRILNRPLRREVFVTFVGVDFLHFVEECSDNPEADLVQTWQVTGKTAVTDDWEGQIYKLQDQLKSAEKQIDDLKDNSEYIKITDLYIKKEK